MEYVLRSRNFPPPIPTGTFWERYGKVIDHVRRIDQHDAFEDESVSDIFELIEPAYVTYEFLYETSGEWTGKIRRQRRAMARIHNPGRI